ncbi:hypothetical protein [Nannocystis bainbridge]|uniref:Uncharacterized protein n=1 Tax=Nannocystis bainbridge TaxID=2995303 RepID=A0ABT5EA73_9BACT|nr:hypothetical protein [Nannocystis bainbridge]MDC0721681.1 hypothetical protein [Nannocystis bainbridge]
MDTPAGPMVTIKPEADTIRRVVEFTARAIYFHEQARKKRWPGRCVVSCPRFILDDLSPAPEAEYTARIMGALSELQRRNHPGYEWRGPHLEIFAYQLHDIDEHVAMRMIFYGAFEFLAVSKPEGRG